MCIRAKLTDIIDTITYCCPRTETSRSDIYSIGTMVNGRDAILQILGGGK